MRLLALTLALPVLLAGAAFAGPKDKDKAKSRAPVVAVLPFKVLNKEANLAHYGEGAADTVINKIVNDRTLGRRRVPARQGDQRLGSQPDGPL